MTYRPGQTIMLAYPNQDSSFIKAELVYEDNPGIFWTRLYLNKKIRYMHLSKHELAWHQATVICKS